jgi:thiamine pyrophosphate-dependent acetolactate synthase large subunit-like protein
MSGKQALVEQLIADGVRYVFGNPGTTEQAFLDTIGDYPELEFILCLHEGVAVSMADAYARATGKPAFVQIHIAPGLGNALGMIFNAKAGHSPLLVYAGQASSDALLQEPILSEDLVAMANPLTKWAWEARHAADIAPAVRRGMKTAEEPAQGPVFLSVPIDVMEQNAEVSIEPTSYVRWRVRPDQSAIDEAGELLSMARSPVLVVGDGIALSSAQSEVAQLAEMLGAPIYNGYASEVTVAQDHPLFAGALPRGNADAPSTIERILGEHDVVVAVGTPLFRFVFPQPGPVVPAHTRVVHIDTDGWEIGKNLPAVLGIKSDCRAGLVSLLDNLRGRSLKGVRERTEAITRDVDDRRRRALEADRTGWDGPTISAPRLMSELASVLSDDAVIFDEATSAGAALARYMKLAPGRYFRARGGGIGPGMPGPVGLKLAMPDHPVVGVVSDGSAMYSITALWTAAHHRIPVTWVICNNARYGILEQNMRDYRGDTVADRGFVGTDLSDPPLRFAGLAESLGVHGCRVDRLEDLRPALEEALRLDAPALVDVAIDSTS